MRRRKIMKLVDITEENFKDVIKIELSDEQKKQKYVADVMYCLAEYYTYRDDKTVSLHALEKDKEIVGFAALYTQIETKSFYIWRLIIDKNKQGLGLGQEALEVIEKYVRNLKEYAEIIADYVEGNDVMKHLLEKNGYVYNLTQEEYSQISMAKELK